MVEIYPMKNLFNGYLKQVKLKLNKCIKIGETNDLEKTVDNHLLKRNEFFDYYIFREQNSRAYIMSFPNLIIIVISKKSKTNIEDFELLYNDSSEYLFNVYETERYYHIICVSAYKKTQEEFDEWLQSNDADLKYTTLTKLYNSFLIMNKIWYIPLQPGHYQFKYKFIKTIGKGYINSLIQNTVNHCINLINNYYMNFLPSHYLSFP
jgi:hypothetical protein